MARWDPSDKIENNEHVGRRLFDEPMLSGVGEQPPFGGIQITHFEETRDDKLSLDRLGRTGIENKVISYLMPRAQADGRKFSKPKSFDGWAFVKAARLTNAPKPPSLQIFCSRIAGPPPTDNIYHSHVCRPANLSSYNMALHLRHLFTQYGDVKTIRTIGHHSWIWRWLTCNRLVQRLARFANRSPR